MNLPAADSAGSPSRRFLAALMALFLCTSMSADPAAGPDFSGRWVYNQELSDDPDKAVERAIKKAGGRTGTKKRGYGRYRGGPANQELYDRITYDRMLVIEHNAPEFRFTYDDGFTRVFHTDGRPRTASATGSASGDGVDFSFGSLSPDALRVESRPRDGGWTREVYRLEAGGQRLRVELEMKPLSFLVPITLVRIYDRQAGPGAP